MAELRLKTEAHDGTWHLGDTGWSVDQELRQIVFTAPGGITATCTGRRRGTAESLGRGEEPAANRPFKKWTDHFC